MQGDARFGDIRLSAYPMSGEVVALASPFDLLGGTHSGDVELNSTALFGQGVSQTKGHQAVMLAVLKLLQESRVEQRLCDSQLEKISFNNFESSSKFSAQAGSTGTIWAPLTFMLSS